MDNKMLFGAFVLIGVVVAGFWFGWFEPVTKSLKAVKKNTVRSR